MAKRVLTEHYSFTPATKTIIFPNKIITQEQLLLITNVSSNTVVFNFSDPDLSVASFTVPYSSTGTRIVLNYNTASMSSSDPLSVLIDEIDMVDFRENYVDPTNKLRVTQPQSLIDTDFEYGLQPIKWESIARVQNYPSFYYRGGGNSFVLRRIYANNASPRSLVTVITDQLRISNIVTSDVISVQGTSNYLADGVFNVQNVIGTTSFTYLANGQVSGELLLSANTTVAGGDIYDSNNVPARILHTTMTSDNAVSSVGSMVTVNTNGRHGLVRGSPILINSSTTSSINGNWNVYDIPTPTSFRFRTANIQTTTSNPVTSNAIVLVRPEVSFLQRPSDGGVLISTGAIQEGVQAVRQTRRYFRYQSGKGLQMSTGTKFTPTFDLNGLTASGTSAVVVTQQRLGISSGITVLVENVEVNNGTTNYYNGEFIVQAAYTSSNTFVYNMTGTPSDVSPGGPLAQVTFKNWKGAVVRSGMFDDQNGFYFEYDGSSMAVVRRTSNRELIGSVTVTSNSVTVSGANTKFSKQLIVGDYVVIRGQSHQVTDIASDTEMSIAPAYRGVNMAGVRCNLTRNIKIPQHEWNLDKCDGTGPSGYNLDVTKMQMCYIDYTWYGAGFVRYGFRMTTGDVAFCHKIANNNVNNAAYMRSGNLPARYEVSNVGPYSRFLSASDTSTGVTLGSSDTLMVVKDAKYWPDSAEIMVQQGNNIEVMSYNGRAENTNLAGWELQNLTRRQFGGTTSNVSFFATEFDGGSAGSSSQCSVSLITCNLAPTISHWGTSVIMDGGYDDDKSIVFSYGKRISTTVNANTSIALVSIRLAPSVDNSITGALGEREIVNRMQLKLNSIGTNSRGVLLISGILNPKSYVGANSPSFPNSWATTSVVASIGAGSLAQVIDHTGNTVTVIGGEQIFSFFTDVGVNTYDLGEVRDLGNSVVAGDGSQASPGFPVGPDVLTIVATNPGGGTTSITGLRISWTEAQA